MDPYRLFALGLTAFFVLSGLPSRSLALEHPRMVDGFREVKLGRGKEEFEGLAFSRAIPVPVDFETEGECRLYTLKGEDLSYLGVPLEKVEYGFVEDRLDRIVVHARGTEAFRAFAGDAIERYGTERDPPASFELSWEDEGAVQTETIVILHEAIRHEDAGELEHRWIWGVQDSGWIFYELSIRLHEASGAVSLTVAIPVST